jgi:hypothetical protein
MDQMYNSEKIDNKEVAAVLANEIHKLKSRLEFIEEDMSKLYDMYKRVGK